MYKEREGGLSAKTPRKARKPRVEQHVNNTRHTTRDHSHDGRRFRRRGRATRWRGGGGGGGDQEGPQQRPAEGVHPQGAGEDQEARRTKQGFGGGRR